MGQNAVYTTGIVGFLIIVAGLVAIAAQEDDCKRMTARGILHNNTRWKSQLRPTRLVFTRRLDQTILLGDPKSGDTPIEITVAITVVEVRGDQVRLGVKAPRSVSVDRAEVWEKQQREMNSGEKAAQPDPRQAGDASPTVNLVL